MARFGSHTNDDILMSLRRVALTPGASVSLTAPAAVEQLIATLAAAQNHTLNLSGTPPDNALLTLIITNDGLLPRVTTLGTGFSGVGPITGVVSKRSLVQFVADGGGFVELARIVGV